MHYWGLDTTAWQMATVLHIKWDPSPGGDVGSTKGVLTFWLSYISGSWDLFLGLLSQGIKEMGNTIVNASIPMGYNRLSETKIVPEQDEIASFNDWQSVTI